MTLRDAFRGLSRSPAFSLTTLLVMALGLGTNIMFFNAVHALLWRPLAFPQSEGVLFVQLQGDRAAGFSATGRDAAVLHDHVPDVAEIGLVNTTANLALSLGDQTLDLTAAEASSGYFRLLRLQPLVGQFFGPEEDLDNPTEQKAVLTESAWRSRFQSDLSVVGRTFMTESGTERYPVRILGVVRSGVTLPFAANAEIVTAIPWMDTKVRAQGSHFYKTLVRLRPGVSREQGSAEIQTVFRTLGNLGPEFPLDRNFRLDPLRQVVIPAQPAVLFLLYGAAGLLLLLTAANVASLFLARALSRAHEMAVRQALGAEHRHLFLTYFMDSFLVCAGGLALAMALNFVAGPIVLALMPELIRVGSELLRPGWALLGFGTALCLAVSILLAALVAFQPQRVELANSMGDGGHAATEGRHPVRAALLPAQVAIILVLLTVASLVTRSCIQALTLDPGFRSKGAYCFEVVMPDPANRWAPAGFELLGLAANLPGTKAATFSKGEPVGRGSRWVSTICSHPGPALPQDPQARFMGISTSYFETLGTRIMDGRGFTEAEVRADSPVVILNSTLAKQLFQNQNPLGRSVRMGMGNRQVEVVGIVQDLRSHALDQSALPEFFIPYFSKFGASMTVTVRTDLAPGEFERAFRSRMGVWNGGARMRKVKLLADLSVETLGERFRASALIAGVAFLGLVIGATGLYGTLSTQVTRGRREIGMRMALGARTGEILALVLGRGARRVGIGMALGLLGSSAVAHLLANRLYGIGPMDPIAFSFAALVLGLVCFLASLIPALRAASVDPAQVLRGN
ncbi:ABC transporter permease [Mesoterricola silvestris]|nr:ABC transporter permease [Mesoterricola silvestris]